MVQAIWTGSLSFGLVNIPVRLYPATQPKDVRFHRYDRRTGKRVRYERVTRAEESATFAPDPDFSMLPRESRTELPAARTSESEWVRESGHGAQAVDPDDLVRGVELPEGDLVTSLTRSSSRSRRSEAERSSLQIPASGTGDLPSQSDPNGITSRSAALT
jgi:non-homologous end joining protein Ku